MGYSLEQLLNDSKNKIGLYHYNCHCQEISIPNPTEKDIRLICPEGKIGWLFRDKSEWIRRLGYEPNEKFVDYVKDLVVKNYCLGQYKIKSITKYRVIIEVYIDIEGKGEEANRIFVAKSGWMVFSNGKLKCNTFLSGRT